MPDKQQDDRSQRAKNLKVFEIEEGQYLVESEKGKILYKVGIDNGNRRCTCADYTSNAAKNSEFTCKHLLAAMGANGNGRKIGAPKRDKPKLDDRFITKIEKKGTVKEFVVYAGLLDLAHQIGLKSIKVEAVQYPTKENGKVAICKAYVEAMSGDVYIEIGDADPGNVTTYIAPHILRMAATRAKARALRDFTDIGMTCLEELGDIGDDVFGGKKPKKPPANKPPASKPAGKANKEPEKEKAKPAAKKAESKKAESSKESDGKISDAQRNAIFNIGERRGIAVEELEKMAEQTFNRAIDYLSAQDASTFIRNLQQAA
jgi:predicted nucleic acid-binding Zn finger protein